MRVNARIDDESQQQIDYLTAATGKAVSHVLRESVSFYYQHVRAQRAGMKSLFALIGKGDSGREDIASDVKRALGEGLDAKHVAASAQTPIDIAKPPRSARPTRR